MSLIDWLWLAGAWLIGIAGAAVLLASLFRDRARGRTRCPKCWYDLGAPRTIDLTQDRGPERADSAARSSPHRAVASPLPPLPITCPECGARHTTRRRLCKTRRRWRRAAAGLTLVLIAIGAGFARHVHRDGLINATPTWAYTVALPWLEQGGYDEVIRRIRDGEVPQWTYPLLIERSLSLLETSKDETTLIRAATILGRVEIGSVYAEPRWPWKSWASVSEFDGPRATRALAAQLDHPSQSVRDAAAGGLYGQTLSKPATLALMAIDDIGLLHWVMRSGSPDVFAWPLGERWALEPTLPEGTDHLRRELARYGHDPEGGRDFLLGTLEDEDPWARVLAIWTLIRIAGDQDEVRARVLDMAADENELVRAIVIRALTQMEWDERSDEILRAGLRDSSVATSALEAVSHAEFGGRFRDEVRAMLSRRDMSSFDRANAGRVFIALGGDATETLEAYMKIGGREPEWNRAIGLEQLLQGGADRGAFVDLAPETRGRLNRWFERALLESHPGGREAVMRALAWSGGDQRRVFEWFETHETRSRSPLETLASTASFARTSSTGS